MRPMIVALMRCAVFAGIVPTLFPSTSTADEDPAGKPFQALDRRISELEAVVPPLAAGIRSLQDFVAPGQIVVPGSDPCPEGYHRPIFGSAGICVLSPPPDPPPPAPTTCEDGYATKETLPDGSPVPQHLLLCERIGANSANVYITFRGAHSEIQSLTAQCPASFVVTGGGHSAIDIDPIGNTGSVSKNFLVYSSRPLARNQWSISGKFPDAGFHDVTAFAICVFEPPT